MAERSMTFFDTVRQRAIRFEWKGAWRVVSDPVVDENAMQLSDDIAFYDNLFLSNESREERCYVYRKILDRVKRKRLAKKILYALYEFLLRSPNGHKS